MDRTSSAHETEWSLLRAACSAVARRQDLVDLIAKPVDWRILFDLADHHGVEPLLYQRLSSTTEFVPADEMRSLEQSYQTNLHKAMLLSLELIRIYDRLSASGIEVLAYKGLALAETIYGDVALRRAGDIDILIHTSDFSRVRDAVRELGYTPHVPLPEAQQRTYLKSGYECAFDGTAGPNLLEVQWAIQPRFYAVDFDMDGLFRRAATVPVAGRPMRTPCFEDLFVILSLHAAKHVWGRLIWLCDLARIMNLPTLNWGLIAEQAKELRILRILRVGMLLAHRLLAAPIPPAAEASLSRDDAAEQLAQEIQPLVTSDKLFKVESFEYFRLMLRLRESNSDRSRFLTRLIGTPGPGEWEVLQLPAPLSPLYRLIRVSRLASRLLRT
jgi:hypothetical protein